MFRMRRYRLFLLLTVFVTAAIYHLSRSRNWDVPDVERFTSIGQKHNEKTTQPRLFVDIPPTRRPVAHSNPSQVKPSSGKHTTTLETPAASPIKLADLLHDVTPGGLRIGTKTVTNTASTATRSFKSRPPTEAEKKAAEEEFVEEFRQHGQGRLEADSSLLGTTMARWEKQPERFPVPPGKTIPLPSASLKSLPKIQYAFPPESSSEKTERLRKLAMIKEAFLHSWTGYRELALPHDELKPVSGTTADPFMGWGATLVDALDSLWILGLKDEFHEAVEAVAKIDFHTSARKDIPLFETTIRYLGGLLSAYDVSSGDFPILLTKAKELAEVLIGAFDTPNRMPLTYYYWAPSYASQPHRAETRVVLAEIGSLAVEFTRLAQLTKEGKYYDAIARITNALEDWQMNTNLPGLWPAFLDASGCKKPNHPVEVASPLQQGPLDVSLVKYELPVPAELDKRQLDDSSIQRSSSPSKKDEFSPVQKRGLPVDPSAALTSNPGMNGTVDCEPQGLGDVPSSTKQTFSIGAMADSTYEYFPKEYILLGGQNEQYRTMYEHAVEAIKDNIIFRPMTKNADDVLAVGKLELSTQNAVYPSREMIFEGSHLSCFAGGMFALGAKVFERDADLEIGRKLTEGCIWAYESTATGIMPDSFEMLACESQTHCEWNETAWHEALDPNHATRIATANAFNEKQKTYVDESAKIRQDLQTETKNRNDPSARSSPPDFSKPLSPEEGSLLRKRQADDLPNYPQTTPTKTTATKAGEVDQDITQPHPPTVPVNPLDTIARYEAPQPMSHEEYVSARIRDERLPPGFTRMISTAYHLRPEAIESVFIMYRLTGQEKWRDAGWKMFQAVESYTRTEHGHATIQDVTASAPVLKDTMESFWLAETLKYFYLLFSEPDVVNLDEWVLNTEAHPFKRPT